MYYFLACAATSAGFGSLFLLDAFLYVFATREKADESVAVKHSGFCFLVALVFGACALVAWLAAGLLPG